jgi:hypothetical protein
VILVLRGALFFSVRDWLLAAAGGKRIRFGIAMSDSTEVNRASNANPIAAAVVMAVSVIFIVMFAAPAFTSASATSTRRTFARTAGASCCLREQTHR